MTILVEDPSGPALARQKREQAMKIHPCGDDMNKAHELTRAKRWSDMRVCNSLTTTQVWKWRGGDAIVVLAKDPYSSTPKGYSVVRMGKKVEVYEGAIRPVLEGLGIKKVEVADD